MYTWASMKGKSSNTGNKEESVNQQTVVINRSDHCLLFFFLSKRNVFISLKFLKIFFCQLSQCPNVKKKKSLKRKAWKKQTQNVKILFTKLLCCTESKKCCYNLGVTGSHGQLTHQSQLFTLQQVLHKNLTTLTILLWWSPQAWWWISKRD